MDELPVDRIGNRPPIYAEKPSLLRDNRQAGQIGKSKGTNDVIS